MKKAILMMILALSATSCTLSPPPPQCVDDGRGMVPLNPGMLTQEQIKAVKAGYKATS